MKPNQSMMALQIALEEEATVLGYNRYMQQLEGLKESSRYADKGAGAAAVRRYTDLVAEALKVQLDAMAESTRGQHATGLSLCSALELTPEAIAAITLRQLVAGAEATERTLSRVAISLANRLYEEVNFLRLKKDNPDAYKIMQRHLPTKVAKTRHAQRVTKHETGYWESLPQNRALPLGVALVKLVQEVTGLFEIKQIQKSNKRTVNIVVASDHFLKWLREGHEAVALSQPVLLPTIVPPKPWTGPTGGGYYSAAIRPLPLVRTRNDQYLRSLAQYDLTEVLAAINTVQEVAWKINTNVLDVMQKCWDRGIEVGDLLNGSPKDVPEFPPEWEGKVQQWKEVDEDGYKQWAIKAALIHRANTRLKSKRAAASSKLHIARKMKDYERIYFPHTMDFRGRIYPVVQSLSPQGDDVSKSLLCFAEGKPLGDRGEYWLKIHVANCFGIDKVSFQERIEWVDDRMELLLASAIDPLQDHFWREADDPWQALAACFELLGASINGPDHVSYISIPMDGSCNGLQNFSALLRDEVGGKATNLVPRDRPADIYTEVAEVVSEIVAEDARRGNKYAMVWEGNISRKVVKQPVMTLPYGATRSGMQRQLEDAMNKHLPTLFPRNETWGACTYLADVTYEAIGQVVIAARSAMDWLREVAKLAASEQYPIRWTSPMGLPVVQDYRQTVGKKVDFHVMGQRYQMRLNRDTDKLDRKKQSAAISPNLIHSYDAAHLMRTALLAKHNGITSMAFIHDSYGTHACDTDILHACLRDAFIEQYSTPLLQRFRDEIADQLPPEVAAELPELPPVGTLDLDVIRESRYFFA